MKTFREILSMVSEACATSFYTGDKDVKSTVIECATRIYIAQMRDEV